MKAPGYSGVALGPAVGHSAGLLATLALTAGIPATAITGGRYVAEFTGLGGLAWAFPVAVLAGATVIAAAGADVSGKLQTGLILALFALVTVTAVVAIGGLGVRPPSTYLPEFSRLGGVLTAIYVAFTGWETVAFTFEEHKRPELIPRIFAASYAIVVGLYALLLLGLFAVVEPGDDAVDSAPLLVLAERSLGDLGLPATVVIVVAAITANVVASVLALSRLVFGLARSGQLPARLSRVRERDHNPVTSVLVAGLTLTFIAVLGCSGLFRFENLFIVSGGIYFVLYGLGAASFARLAHGDLARVVTALCAVTVLAVSVLAGPPLWWCWVLLAAVWLGTTVFGRRSSPVQPR